jgi:ribosomal-protein-alanine N-acetyltransferase
MTDSAGLSVFSIRVRPMQAGDIFRVMEIADVLPHAPHWPVSAYQSALNPNAEPHRIAIVAEELTSGVLAGFVVASLVAGEAELESIAVAAETQRRGLGGQLLRHLFTLLSESNVARINLEVRASNHPALGLYQRHGFNETGRRAGYYADPAEDAVLMCLDLG